MRSWLIAFAGLLIWAGHFFALYVVASFFPGNSLARWFAGGLTILALGLLALVVRRIRKRTRDPEVSTVESWIDGLASLGVAIAAASIVLQSLPAAIG